ncbi:hypothetical protein Clocel_2714 [Clostridium cellulovorans 743B]|uniref:Uncharacterized protein n=1 Tax=Clostridium cellulovorans (strain ATCC 35296 / DSM 3052 / OCM 3 / 743B) TaxID=573061 RepID=D9SRI2_CLOC7|nr:hypothetical protein Clocel_2714 [Clostridium cellulovorans 743B]
MLISLNKINFKLKKKRFAAYKKENEYHETFCLTLLEILKYTKLVTLQLVVLS